MKNHFVTHRGFDLLSSDQRFMMICLLLCVCSSACSNRYLGVLPPQPLWLQVDLQQFNAQEREVIYGRGHTVHQMRIDQRRLIAEANAVADVRDQLTQRVLLIMKSGNHDRKAVPSEQELQAVKNLLKGYPWSQATTIEGRFFDAELNTQHAIASLSLSNFEKTLSFDPSDATTKAATIEYVRLAYQSLRP